MSTDTSKRKASGEIPRSPSTVKLVKLTESDVQTGEQDIDCSLRILESGQLAISIYIAKTPDGTRDWTAFRERLATVSAGPGGRFLSELLTTKVGDLAQLVDSFCPGHDGLEDSSRAARSPDPAPDPVTVFYQDSDSSGEGSFSSGSEPGADDGEQTESDSSFTPSESPRASTGPYEPPTKNFRFSKIKKADVEKHMGLKLHQPMLMKQTFDDVMHDMAYYYTPGEGSDIKEGEKDLPEVVDGVLAEGLEAPGWRWRMEKDLVESCGSYEEGWVYRRIDALLEAQREVLRRIGHKGFYFVERNIAINFENLGKTVDSDLEPLDITAFLETPRTPTTVRATFSGKSDYLLLTSVDTKHPADNETRSKFLHSSRSVAALARHWPFLKDVQLPENPSLEEGSDGAATSEAWRAVFMEAKPLRGSTTEEMDKKVPQAAAQAFAGFIKLASGHTTNASDCRQLVRERGVPWILATSSTFEFGVIVSRDRDPRKRAGLPWESHSVRARWDNLNEGVASSDQCTATLKGILTALVLWNVYNGTELYGLMAEAMEKEGPGLA